MGWNNKNLQGERVMPGCWSTTNIQRHVRKCPSMPAAESKTISSIDSTKEEKIRTEKGIDTCASSPMPLKMNDGEVVFSENLKVDTRQAALTAIARCLVYAAHRLPDRSTECPWERDKLRLVYKAGYEAALKGNTDLEDYPRLNAKNVKMYVEAEDDVQRAYGAHWAAALIEASHGNPHSQVQSDIVTLGDSLPWQSIGNCDVCAKTDKPMVVNTGFRHVVDKSNVTCAEDMEFQSSRFFGAPLMSVSNSSVTDVGAFGLGATLEEIDLRLHPHLNRTLQKEKCAMHQTMKLCAFGMGNYSYKDGSGGEKYNCPPLEAFNADFRTLERTYHNKVNARLLQDEANTDGDSASLRCRSNFCTTRAAGEMFQHLWALRASKPIRLVNLKHAGHPATSHTFKGER
jgi:hypothetical protein